MERNRSIDKPPSLTAPFTRHSYDSGLAVNVTVRVEGAASCRLHGAAVNLDQRHLTLNPRSVVGRRIRASAPACFFTSIILGRSNSSAPSATAPLIISGKWSLELEDAATSGGGGAREGAGGDNWQAKTGDRTLETIFANPTADNYLVRQSTTHGQQTSVQNLRETADGAV